MLGYFEKATKPIFKDAKESAYIKFGSMGCNDPKAKIRRGQLLLNGYVDTRLSETYGLILVYPAVQRWSRSSSPLLKASSLLFSANGDLLCGR